VLENREEVKPGGSEQAALVVDDASHILSGGKARQEKKKEKKKKTLPQEVICQPARSYQGARNREGAVRRVQQIIKSSLKSTGRVKRKKKSIFDNRGS